MLTSHCGTIEVITGPMFSGKTEELLRRVKRCQIARQKVQVFKPGIDNRYSEDHVQSHDSSKISSIQVKSAGEILKKIARNARVVAIDEVQFLDDEVVEVIEQLSYRGIRIIAGGLDLDSRGKPFGPMGKLLAIADHVLKLTAICTVCGSAASRTQRLCHSQQDNQVLVGAAESYEARCRDHHEPESHLPSTLSQPGRAVPQINISQEVF